MTSASAGGRSGMSRTRSIPCAQALFGIRYAGFPGYLAAVVELCGEVDILVRDGQDPARDGEDLAHLPHGLVEGAGHAVERSEEEVAKALALEAAPSVKR